MLSLKIMVMYLVKKKKRKGKKACLQCRRNSEKIMLAFYQVILNMLYLVMDSTVLSVSCLTCVHVSFILYVSFQWP